MKKYIPFCLLFTLFAVACKKSSNNTPAPATPVYYLATVQRIESNVTDNYRISYNAQNQVDTIIQPWGFLAFSYSASSYNALEVEGTYNSGYTIYTNADGNITHTNTYDSLFATYNSNGRISSQSTYIGGSPYATYIYAWVNGDIDSASQNNSFNGTLVYYYDLSHSWLPGDGFGIDDFLRYGRPVVRSAHLLTQSHSTNGSLITYKYNFDSKSRITQLTKNFDGESTIYKYTYTAN